MALVVSSGNVGSHCPDADLPSFVTDVRGLGDVGGAWDIVKAPFKAAAGLGKKAIGVAFGGARKALGAAIGGGGGGGGEGGGGGYMPAPVAPPAPSFPIVPVAIGGVALVGLAAFLLTRKKTTPTATASRARRRKRG